MSDEIVRLGGFSLGQAVDLWCASNRNWAGGFAVDSTTLSGVMVRRTSDGALLPAVFEASDVRPADMTHARRPALRRRR